ncbi:MAG: endonuclease III [Thermodesulfobacteriota bacterium]
MRGKKISSPQPKTDFPLPERVSRITAFLRKTYPDAKCHLNYSSAFELLVGSILSAQCTDERVNSITPGLFKKYPAPSNFARADAGELEKDIFSTGFYRNKARSIIRCSGEIVRSHGGKVPATMEELSALPGVGRKTANVILGNWFGKPGIIVDTHITRLSRRLAMSSAKTAEGIEREIMEVLPEKDRTFFSNSLGDHGRLICKARKPLCERCGISGYCVWRKQNV